MAKIVAQSGLLPLEHFFKPNASSTLQQVPHKLVEIIKHYTILF